MVDEGQWGVNGWRTDQRPEGKKAAADHECEEEGKLRLRYALEHAPI